MIKQSTTFVLSSLALLVAVFLALNRSTQTLAEPFDSLPPRRPATNVATHGYVFDEHFANAPTEWRVAGAGVIEVMNRWQCEPKWTFCSLYNNPAKGKAAVLWNKRFFPNDVAIEFYVGIKMDHTRGNPYAYAKEINVTIGSDGSDLRKGVTFSFGGFNNTCSYIMRDGVELARQAVRIPTTMDYSRHWFPIRAERRDGKLIFKADHFFQNTDHRSSEWIVDDPKPPAGNRIAIWTYDDGIMLARVRLSGEASGIESPDFVAGPMRTIYDMP